MKIAVTGKGGVGKTLISSIFAKLFSDKGLKVFAIDADPDTNLALTLGFPGSSEIIPLVEMKQLIEERTGAKPGSTGSYFKLNPKVDDIPDKYFLTHQGISLATMGSVRGGGLGCRCPENSFLKALLRNLIVERDEVVILDMEAGIEHLGRGTVESVDFLLIVIEPGRRSIETAGRIEKLATEIGLKKVVVVGNKVRTDDDKNFMKQNLKLDFLGFISYNEKLIQSDIRNLPFYELCPEVFEEGRVLLRRLEENGKRVS